MLWNRLPASIVLAENIHLFKKTIETGRLFLRNAREGFILGSNTVTDYI